MKKLIRTFTLTLALATTAHSFADSTVPSETRVVENVIRYANTILPVDRGGFPYRMGMIGGNVLFTGTGPVYVSLYIGGQSYTALTDERGDYSFFVFTNNASRFEVRAWVNGSRDDASGIKKSGVLSQK